MSDLRDAACVGKTDLFESTTLDDHVRARAICDMCPAMAACRKLLDDERQLYYGHPVGTWAGELVGNPNGHGFAAKPRACGTDRGYYQHIHRGEETCRMCRAAHRAAYHERKVG